MSVPLAVLRPVRRREVMPGATVHLADGTTDYYLEIRGSGYIHRHELRPPIDPEQISCDSLTWHAVNDLFVAGHKVFLVEKLESVPP